MIQTYTSTTIIYILYDSRGEIDSSKKKKKKKK